MRIKRQWPTLPSTTNESLQGHRERRPRRHPQRPQQSRACKAASPQDGTAGTSGVKWLAPWPERPGRRRARRHSTSPAPWRGRPDKVRLPCECPELTRCDSPSPPSPPCSVSLSQRAVSPPPRRPCPSRRRQERRQCHRTPPPTRPMTRSMPPGGRTCPAGSTPPTAGSTGLRCAAPAPASPSSRPAKGSATPARTTAPTPRAARAQGLYVGGYHFARPQAADLDGRDRSELLRRRHRRRARPRAGSPRSSTSR